RTVGSWWSTLPSLPGASNQTWFTLSPSVRGDVDADGKADALAFYDLGSDSQRSYTAAYEWPNISTGLSDPTQVWNSTPSGFTWANAKWVDGDFNGDGRSDAVAFYNLGCDAQRCYTGAYEWLGTRAGLSPTVTQVWNSTPGGFTWANAKWVAGD